MLNVDLKILPLKAVEFFVHQKCLLPTTVMENLRPGDWIKCVTDNGQGFLCQAYLREMAAKTCQLDDSVLISNTVNMEQGTVYTMQHVQHIEVMEYQKTAVEEVHLIFVLDAKIFDDKMSKDKLDEELLRKKSMPTLLTHTLCNNCIVSNSQLSSLGIAKIKVKAATAENLAFNISERTNLQIEDVQMQWENLSTKKLHTNILAVYEEAHEELKKLLVLSKREDFYGGLNAIITGVSGVGKSVLVKTFLQQKSQNHINCFPITISGIMGQYPGEIQMELRHIFQSAKQFVQKFKPKFSTVIFIEDLHLLCPATTDANGERICAELLRLVDDLHAQKLNIICLATTTSATALCAQSRRAGRFERDIHLAPPNSLQRRQLFEHMWNNQLGPMVPLTDSLLQQIEQANGYVAADIELVVRKITDEYWLHGNENFCADSTLKTTLQNILPNALNSTDIRTYKITEDLSSLGGMKTFKRLFAKYVLNRLKFADAYKRFGLPMFKGILLYGPPGCAKTTIAKCLAAEAKMTFISTSGAEVYSPYVGCAERFLTKLFDTARKNAPCLIFLDEIDTLVGKRSLSKERSDNVQMRILSTLLTEMDGIVSSGDVKILVVAATNRPDMLDDALLRPGRFDKLIHVPAPDLPSRLAIFEIHAKRMPFNGNVDMQLLAEGSHNFSGADICNLCNEAALAALQRDFETIEIRMEDFVHVLETYKSSLDQDLINRYITYEQIVSDL